MADNEPADFSERFNAAALPQDTLPSTEMFGTPGAMATAVPRALRAIFGGLTGGNILGYFGSVAEKGVNQGLTPAEETEAGITGALATIGSASKFMMPKGTAAAFNAFHEQVTTPAAERIVANPTVVEPVRGSDIPASVPRTDLALTGEPHIDAVLTSLVTKDAIDNVVVDRTHDVPYTAGGSVPLADPTMFVDKNFPRAFNIDGKVFDPADPFAIHENIEQHTMDILTKGGMTDEEAYRVAHFEFAEKAEGAWYRAHGIDQEKAEAAYAPHMAAIQHPPTLAEGFHGTNKEITGPLAEFGGTRGGVVEDKGVIYFSAGKKLAEGYGKYVHERTIDLSNSQVFDVDELTRDPAFQADMRASLDRNARRNEYLRQVAETPEGKERIEKAWQNILRKVTERKDNDYGLPRYDSSITGAIISRARAAGLDVAVVKNMAEGHGKATDQYIVLNEKAVHEPDFPPNLYKRPYPHDKPSAAFGEAIAEPRPSPEEINRAKQIIADWQAKGALSPEAEAPKPTVNPLAEARELGVIGPDRPDVLSGPPREAAARATQDVLRGPAPGEQSPWRQRWERTLDKMQTPGDARRVISSIVEANDEFQAARQGDLSPAQIEQLGAVAGLDTAQIDRAATSAKIKTNVEMRNTIEAFRSMNGKIKEAADAVRMKKGAADDAEVAELTRLELQRDLLLDATTSTKEFVALRAEFGRLGNVIQEFMAASKDANAMRGVLRDKLGNSMDDVRNRARLIADTDDRALPKVLNPNARVAPTPWYFHLWTNFIISGLITHSKYAVVNSVQTISNQVAAPFVAAVIDKSLGRDASLLAPVWAYSSMIHSFPDAVRGSYAALKSGERFPSISEMELAARGKDSPMGAPTPYQTGNKVDWGIWKRVFNEDQLAQATKITGVPSRSANALHTFYRLLNDRGSLGRQAYEKAFAEKPGSNAEFWQSYERHYSNPTDEMLQKAAGEGYDGTFMAKMGKRMTELSHTVKNNPFLRWAFPFMHIPEEIGRTAVRHSPLAAFAPEMRAQLMGERGQPAQSLAIAKVVLGTSAMSYFVAKAMNGEMTGSYPINEKERARWRDLGLQPNSVAANEEWHSMERLGPYGILAGLSADLAHVWQHYDSNDQEAVPKVIAGLGLAFANALGNDVGFQSINNVMDFLQGRQKPGEFVGYEASTFLIPSLVRQYASYDDPNMREVKSILDGIKYATPFVRESLPAKRDPLYGEPRPNPGYGTFGRSVPVQKDYAKQELDRIGYYPTPPHNTIGGVTLTPEQYDKYQATAGPLVKQALTSLVSSPQWRLNSPEWQKMVAKEIIASARKKAAGAMQLDDPSLILAGRERRLKQINGTQ